MSPVVDLHPDDLAARVDLRAALRERRLELGLSGEQVAERAGFLYRGAVRSLENKAKMSWEAWRVQQWARGLGLMFLLHIDGLPVPGDDAMAMVLHATTTFGSFDEDQLHLLIVAHDLVRTRQAMKVSRAELARRCRVDENAIRNFEDDPRHSRLRTYQRYARALGGSLVLQLAPVEAEVTS